MDSGRPKDLQDLKELGEKINQDLLTLFLTLSSVNSDVSVYKYWHTVEKIRLDPSAWDKIDEAYTIYEEQANDCRRHWMKLRSMFEKEKSQMNAAGTSSVVGIGSLGRPPPPLEYQSGRFEGELGEIKRKDLPPKPKSEVRPRLSHIPVTTGAILRPRKVTLLLRRPQS